MDAPGWNGDIDDREFGPEHDRCPRCGSCRCEDCGDCVCDDPEPHFAYEPCDEPEDSEVGR